MPMVNVENLGSSGIIQDVENYELPPEMWTDGQNVRFKDRAAQPARGETTVFGSPPIAGYGVWRWFDGSANYWLIADANEIYRTETGIYTNITRYTTTPGDDDYSGNSWPIWTGGILHGVPILNHDGLTDYPQQWNSGTSRMKDLDNWPANTYAKIIRLFGNYVIALDVTKSGTRYPFMVKWSHPADPGTVPTSWDETDPTVDAGEYSLGETPGIVIDCLPLGNANIIYKQDSAWSMTHIGPPYIFNFRQVKNSSGIFAPRCACEFMQKHFVVTQNDIVISDGVREQSIIDDKNREKFFGSVDSEYRDHVFVVPKYDMQEIWICYPETGISTMGCNKALVWNWKDNTWAFKDLPFVLDADLGVINDTGVIGGETFDGSAGVTFDNDTGGFGQRADNPIVQNLLMTNATNLLYMDHGFVDYTGAARLTRLERTGLTIVGQDRQGNIKVDQSVVKFLRGLWPKITGTAGDTITIYVGYQMNPNDAITWETYDFVIGTDEKIDPLVTGKYLAIAFEASLTRKWKLHSYKLDLEPAGMF